MPIVVNVCVNTCYCRIYCLIVSSPPLLFSCLRIFTIFRIYSRTHFKWRVWRRGIGAQPPRLGRPALSFLFFLFAQVPGLTTLLLHLKCLAGMQCSLSTVSRIRFSFPIPLRNLMLLMCPLNNVLNDVMSVSVEDLRLVRSVLSNDIRSRVKDRKSLYFYK